jgi:hypothetical protein
LFSGHGRVLQDIVQQGSDQGLRIHAHLGQDRGDGERMFDIGFTAQAALACMRFGTKRVSAPYLLDLSGIQIGLDEGA